MSVVASRSNSYFHGELLMIRGTSSVEFNLSWYYNPSQGC